MKTTKSNTIMIGDNLKSDIKSAQGFGMKAIWINRNKNKTEELKPDYEITNLSEIFKIITEPLNSMSYAMLSSQHAR